MKAMSVKTGRVNDLSADLRADANELAKVLHDLESEVGKLLGKWDGAAQDAYRSAQARWTNSLMAINQVLRQISDATGEISTQYSATDKQAASFFGA
jgi:WXG100 family type VII secretion target